MNRDEPREDGRPGAEPPPEGAKGAKGATRATDAEVRAVSLPGAPPERTPRPLRERVVDIVRDVEAKAASSERARVRVPLFFWRVSIQVIRQWARDRCPQQAASLAFQTMLSLVPAMAVCLAAFRATGQLEAESALVRFLAESLIPVSPREIAHHLHEWTGNVTFESLGLVGLISTVILAFIMFNSLERVINYIWRVERRRSVAQRFVVFYATATIGPFLIGTSIVQAAKVGLTHGFAGYLLSFGTTFLAVFLANYFLPAIKLRIGAAAIGSLLTTVLLEGAKYLFNFYVSSYAIDRFAGIYGAVAILPLLLIWIYWSWLMMLLGAEFAHAAQNIQFLEHIERRGPMTLENEILRRINGPTAARVMVAATEAYMRGDKVISRGHLTDLLELSDEVLDRLAERLKDFDLLIEVEGEYSGFMPARPPQEITLAEVLAAFRAEDADSHQPRGTAPLDAVLTEIDADAEARTKALTLDKLATPRAKAPLT